MMSLENEHPPRVVIIGYAFNSLEPDQTETVAAHVNTCPECQAVVARYQARSAKLTIPAQPAAPVLPIVPSGSADQAEPVQTELVQSVAPAEAPVPSEPSLTADQAGPVHAETVQPAVPVVPFVPTSTAVQVESVLHASPVETPAPSVPAAQVLPEARPAPAPIRPASSALPTQPLPPRTARRRFTLTTLNIGLGLAVILLLAANLLQLNQARIMRDEQTDLIRTIQANQVINALVSEPGIVLLPISGPKGQGTLLFEKNGTSGILFLRNLPLLDGGHTYQAWLIPASGQPVSVGTFHANAGTPFASYLINAGQPLKSFSAINVTLEPLEGSPAPSTTPIIAVKL